MKKKTDQARFNGPVSVCNRFDSSDNFLVVADQLQQPEYYTYNKQLILFSSGGKKTQRHRIVS